MNCHDILLCSALCRPSAWKQAIASGITEEFFTDQCQRDLWSAITRYASSGKRHSTAGIIGSSSLDGTKHLARRLLDNSNVLAAADLSMPIRSVILAKRRAEACELSLMISAAARAEGEWDDRQLSALKCACEQMGIVGATLTSARKIEHIDASSIKAEFINHLADNRKRFLSKEPVGFTTGISEIDECLGGGFRSGRMYLVAGRTGGGKSQFAVNAAVSMAAANTRVAFFSAEMIRVDILKRMFASVTEVPFGVLEKGNFDEKVLETAGSFCDATIGDNLISIYHDFDRSLGSIEAILDIEMRGKSPPSVAIVDYAQLLRPSREHRDKLRELQEISASLKSITQRHPIALVVLVQLNRAAAESDAPELHHIAGNDSFAHDCDGALLLHATDVMKKIGCGYIKLRKMRHGEARTVMVGLDFATSRFWNLTPAQKAEMTAEIEERMSAKPHGQQPSRGWRKGGYNTR